MQLINDISNKQLSSDLMTDIVLNIPASQVHDLTSYWECLIGLFNKSVVKTSVFMGLKYLAKELGEEDFIRETVAASYGKIQQELSELSRDTLEPFFEQIIDSNQ